MLFFSLIVTRTNAFRTNSSVSSIYRRTSIRMEASFARKTSPLQVKDPFSSSIPVGIWSQNDVYTASSRRVNANMTSFYAMCPLGWLRGSYWSVIPTPTHNPWQREKNIKIHHECREMSLYGKLLFTRLSLVMSIMVSFCAVLFPTRCLGWDLGLNWVSFWGFSYLLYVG